MLMWPSSGVSLCVLILINSISFSLTESFLSHVMFMWVKKTLVERDSGRGPVMMKGHLFFGFCLVKKKRVYAFWEQDRLVLFSEGEALCPGRRAVMLSLLRKVVVARRIIPVVGRSSSLICCSLSWLLLFSHFIKFWHFWKQRAQCLLETSKFKNSLRRIQCIAVSKAQYFLSISA